jgi:hypothetical protein
MGDIRNANPEQLEELARRLRSLDDGGAYGRLTELFDRARTLDASSELASLQPLLTWLFEAAEQLRDSAALLRGDDPDALNAGPVMPGMGADLGTQLEAASWEVVGQDLADEFAELAEKDEPSHEDLRWMNQILMDYGENPDFAGYLVDEMGMEEYLRFSQQLGQVGVNDPDEEIMATLLQGSMGTTLSAAFWTPGQMVAQTQTAPGYEDSAYQEWLETVQGQRYQERLEAFNRLGTQQLYAEETQMSFVPDERLGYDVALDLLDLSNAPIDEHFFDQTMTHMMELERDDPEVWNQRRYEPDNPDVPGWNSDNDVVDRLLGLTADSNPDAVTTFLDPRLGRHNLDYFTGDGDQARDAGIATEDGESPGLDAALQVTGLSGIFATSHTPQQNKDWWDSLSPDAQDSLTQAYPERVGAMDGLPTEARDSANRIVLESEYDRLSAELDAETDAERRQTLEEKLDGMAGIQERLDQEGVPEAYLLGINTEGDGQYIVANGNPDTAEHTAVFVPGTTCDLGGARGDIRKATELWRESTAMAPGENVSTITWLGYDAPDNAFPFHQGDFLVPDAANAYYAHDAAPDFNSFTEGLDVAHVGEEPSHTTLIGHSYGSTVIGAASLQGEGLSSADDIIAVGSPGMLVDEAEDLGVGSSHVWSMAAGVGEDQVPLFGAPFLGGGIFDVESGPFGLPTIEINLPYQVPSMESFGGNIMDTDSTEHGGYWERESDGDAGLSLLNQARVIVGNYGKVE